MFNKIKDRTEGHTVTSARSPNTMSKSRPQLIHHYALLQFIPVDTPTHSRTADQLVSVSISPALDMQEC